MIPPIARKINAPIWCNQSVHSATLQLFSIRPFTASSIRVSIISSDHRLSQGLPASHQGDQPRRLGANEAEPAPNGARVLVRSVSLRRRKTRLLRMTKSSTTAKRAKRPSKAAKSSPRSKPQALPAKRPGPFDVIADRFDFDRIDCIPARKFGFRLSHGDGDRQTGRMEMPPERAIDHALKILGVAAEWGPRFTPAQRKRIDALHAHVAEDSHHHFGELTPISCEYVAANKIGVTLTTNTGDTVTFPLTSDSTMHLINLLVAAFHKSPAQVYRDLRETPDAAA
jgi:hypothetical protein